MFQTLGFDSLSRMWFEIICLHGAILSSFVPWSMIFHSFGTNVVYCLYIWYRSLLNEFF
jgi:hypothetical protein